MSYFDQLGGEEELGQCPLKMEAKAVEKFQFPVYEKPGHKDDMVSTNINSFSFPLSILTLPLAFNDQLCDLFMYFV